MDKQEYQIQNVGRIGKIGIRKLKPCSSPGPAKRDYTENLDDSFLLPGENMLFVTGFPKKYVKETLIRIINDCEFGNDTHPTPKPDLIDQLKSLGNFDYVDALALEANEKKCPDDLRILLSAFDHHHSHPHGFVNNQGGGCIDSGYSNFIYGIPKDLANQSYEREIFKSIARNLQIKEHGESTYERFADLRKFAQEKSTPSFETIKSRIMNLDVVTSHLHRSGKTLEELYAETMRNIRNHSDFLERHIRIQKQMADIIRENLRVKKF